MRTTIFLAIFLAFGGLFATAKNTPTSQIAYCLACNVPGGLTVTNLTGTTATLSWNAVSTATQYTIEIQDEQITPSLLHIETNVSGTTYQLAGMQTGVHYKFKVRARCGGDKSDWSGWVFFIAGGSTGGSGTCAIPTMLSTSVVGTTAQLTWNKVTGANQYYIEVEDEQNSPSTFHLELAVPDTFYNLTGLQAGVLYKFKVRTHCSSGQSDWSNWLFFNGNSGSSSGSGTGSCTSPIGANVSGLTANTAMLAWNAVSGVLSYTIEIERNQMGSSPWQITQVVSTNMFLLTGLNPNTRYKFKVRSNCTGGGHSDWTKSIKFKTPVSFTDPSDDASTRSAIEDQSTSQATLLPVFEMHVWPNPAQTNTTVRLKHLAAASATIRLFDLTGQLVQEQLISSENDTWEGTLTISDLPNGLYLLQTKNGDNTRTTKLVVSH